MKKSIITAMVLAVIASFASVGCAQGTLTPLYLFTNRSGRITPFQDGQLLEVGQSYDVTAVPDPGFAFSSWQPVNVFVITQTNFVNGNPILPPITSTVPSTAGPQYTSSPQLNFTMQSPLALTSAGANPNISESFGWQANFVPAPEPSIIALLVFCPAATVTMRRRNARSRQRSLLT